MAHDAIIRYEYAHPRFPEVGVIYDAKDGWTGRALDKKTLTRVAVKYRLDLDEEKEVAVTTLREIAYMTAMNHQNVMKIKDVIGSRRTKTIREIYYTMELMHTTLAEYVWNLEESLEDSRIRNWMFQILQGANYIHSAGLVHRDLKPTNILVSEALDVLKITDFDMARLIKSEEPGDLTEVVSTTLIRAPEIMLRRQSYSYAIDIWALGCMFYYLLNREYLVEDVEDHNLLKEIISVIGTPSNEELRRVTRPEIKAYIAKLPVKPKIKWREAVPENVPDSAVSLLESMIKFCDEDRINMSDAIFHDYFEPERPHDWAPATYRGRALTDYGAKLTSCKKIRPYLQRRVTLDIPLENYPK